MRSVKVATTPTYAAFFCKSGGFTRAALSTKYFPRGPARNRASIPATRSSRTCSSEPKLIAVALHVQEAKLASAHPHGDHNFLARPLHRNLVGLDESFLQQRRRRFLVQRQINSHPTIVPPFAQQPGNLFQRRAVKRRTIPRQHFPDVGKQIARGTISSQGAPEGMWRSGSSLMRAGMGVKGAKAQVCTEVRGPSSCRRGWVGSQFPTLSRANRPRMLTNPGPPSGSRGQTQPLARY